MEPLIGVDIGQRTEALALYVAGTGKGVGPHGTEAHHMVRHLERLPPGTSYPALESANDRNGAFRVGARDELVTALGLATQPEPPKPGFYGGR